MSFKWFTLLQFLSVRSKVFKFVGVVLGYFSLSVFCRLFLIGYKLCQVVLEVLTRLFGVGSSRFKSFSFLLGATTCFKLSRCCQGSLFCVVLRILNCVRLFWVVFFKCLR